MKYTNTEQLLSTLGLTTDQATVYLYLLRNGALPANLLSRRTKISRTLTYKILDDLATLDLVRKDDSFKVARFSAQHPYALRALAKREQQQADERARATERAIGPLVAEFNLHAQKPAVHFMEGLDGVSHILDDTLTSHEPIYMYVDTDTLEQDLLDIDERYVQKRLKKKIPKKILMARTPAAEAYATKSRSDLTQIKLITSNKTPHFYSLMYMYDKKVSYITYQDTVFTSAIIYDASLYTMQRFVFESLWDAA